MIDGPEEIVAWPAKGERLSLYYTRTDVAKANEQAAYERGRREALERAINAVEGAGYYCIPPNDETGSLSEQIEHSLAAIRAEIGK